MNIEMLLDNCFDPDVRVYKEAKYLTDNGHNVEILALDRKNKYIDKPYEEYGKIRVKRFFSRTDKATKLLEKNNIISKIFKPIVYFWWLVKFFINARKYMKNLDIDYIHCHDLRMAFMATIFLRKYTMVFDMHEYYCTKKNKVANKFIKWGLHKAQNHARWIIYVNEFQKSVMQEKNLKKLVELPNYPSGDIFKNIEKTESKKLRISYIGAARDYESLKKLVELNLNADEYTIRIHGYGSAYPKLLELAKKIGKEEVVCGPYDGVKEIEGIYRNTDILHCVYSNSNPNWKNAIAVKAFEAILTLTPMIVSKDSALGDLVEKNDIGFTVKNEDKKELEDLLVYIKNNPNVLNEKKQNIKKIQKEYMWETCAKKLDNIYKKESK